MQSVSGPAPTVDADDLQDLYAWVDETPLSRPKKNISRDFADGVLFAEIVNRCFPRLVEMHNYSAANSQGQKMYNWTTLNQKVLKKLGYQIHQQDIDDIINARPMAIERALAVLRERYSLFQHGELKVARRPSAADIGTPAIAAGVGAPPRGSVNPGPLGGQIRAGAGAARSEDGRQPSELCPEPGGRLPNVQRYQEEVDAELLMEKEEAIAELREMVAIMSEKIKKLEQLVTVKDSKIEALNQKLQKYGIP